MKKRTRSNYNGIRKYETPYTGLLFCGDCGGPMFSMSSKQLDPAYTCGTYHRRGRKGCTSHHTRVDFLDSILKMYVQKVKRGSANMIDALEASITDERRSTRAKRRRTCCAGRSTRRKISSSADPAEDRGADAQKPDQEKMINETYDALEAECYGKIRGLESQFDLMADHRNNVIRMNRIAKTALDIFDDILNKPKAEKSRISSSSSSASTYTTTTSTSAQERH